MSNAYCTGKTSEWATLLNRTHYFYLEFWPDWLIFTDHFTRVVTWKFDEILDIDTNKIQAFFHRVEEFFAFIKEAKHTKDVKIVFSLGLKNLTKMQSSFTAEQSVLSSLRTKNFCPCMAQHSWFLNDEKSLIMILVRFVQWSFMSLRMDPAAFFEICSEMWSTTRIEQ